MRASSWRRGRPRRSHARHGERRPRRGLRARPDRGRALHRRRDRGPHRGRAHPRRRPLRHRDPVEDALPSPPVRTDAPAPAHSRPRPLPLPRPSVSPPPLPHRSRPGRPPPRIPARRSLFEARSRPKEPTRDRPPRLAPFDLRSRRTPALRSRRARDRARPAAGRAPRHLARGASRRAVPGGDADRLRHGTRAHPAAPDPAHRDPGRGAGRGLRPDRAAGRIRRRGRPGPRGHLRRGGAAGARSACAPR